MTSNIFWISRTHVQVNLDYVKENLEYVQIVNLEHVLIVNLGYPDLMVYFPL